MTKQFNPTGGVIRASSTIITIITPNQMGSKEREVITGKKIGIVRRIIAMASMNMPRGIYMAIIMAKIK